MHYMFKLLKRKKSKGEKGVAFKSRSKKAEEKKLAREKEILEEERIYRLGTVSIRDLIAPAALEVKPDYIKLNDKFVRTLFVVTYPRYISVGWFAPIININLIIQFSKIYHRK